MSQGTITLPQTMLTKKKKFKPEYLAALLFLLPNLIGFILFTLWPMFYSLVLSFLDWGLLNDKTFVGLSHYKEILSDATFWISFKNTFIYSFVKVPINLLLSLLLAMALNKGLHGTNIFRTVAFLPSVCSAVSVGIIWKPLLESTQSGLVNHLLSYIEINPIAFLSSTQWSMLSVIGVGIWKELGYFMIIYLAGLQGISRTYYEAASIDGANSRQMFFNITIPLIAPTTFFAFVTSLIGSFQIFDLTTVLTGGGPANSTNTLVMYIYQNAFQWFRMGYASALALVLFLVIFIVTMIQNKIADNGAKQ
jgi:multiple sugar transport system permease protein